MATAERALIAAHLSLAAMLAMPLEQIAEGEASTACIHAVARHRSFLATTGAGSIPAASTRNAALPFSSPGSPDTAVP